MDDKTKDLLARAVEAGDGCLSVIQRKDGKVWTVARTPFIGPEAKGPTLADALTSLLDDLLADA